ncbi:hypothetical protein Glove_130g85 [Diversispora epigaea]|uniref:ribonuclease H n=1 Tax=Diversispora epigaea TaxID=1348612 RepID=A0A397IY69_9GLOM|nr:hypothetical protein Glove_130g85 [Diversispora epigaea]
MGCGWYALNENNIEFNFNGKVENFMSSTRAELMAILTAVYATSKRSKLCIFTNSQAAIDAIHVSKINFGFLSIIDAIANASVNPRKVHRKLKNWTIVKAIEEIANVQNLTLWLEKVKIHSGVIHNKTADLLAREVENFMSSTRAELMAILTAVYATSKRSKLCIFTNSQAAIDAIHVSKINFGFLSIIDAIANASVNPRKVHRKLKNWTIVKAIEEIANVQNLTLWLEKVKIHSGVIHNKTADLLAREVSCWNTETIEEPLRHFTKKLGKAKYLIKWRLFNRNISTISAFKSKQIQWESSWRTTMLFYIDRNVTDNKETRQRAFNVKLFNNELPTLVKLKDRFPKIYKNDSCICCNLEKEDQVHVLTCPKNIIDTYSCRNKLINMLVSKTTIVTCGDTYKNMCKTLEILKELHIPRDVSTRNAEHLSFIDVMLGLIPITIYDIVLQKVVTYDLADQIIDDVFNQFKLFLHNHIWKDRCTAIKKWKTENGISNNKWKKKVCNETLDTTVTSQTNNTDNNSVLNNTTQDIAVIGLGCIK